MPLRLYYTAFREWGDWYFWMPLQHCTYANCDQLIGPYPTEEMCSRQALCSHDANINGGEYGEQVGSKQSSGSA